MFFWRYAIGMGTITGLTLPNQPTMISSCFCLLLTGNSSVTACGTASRSLTFRHKQETNMIGMVAQASTQEVRHRFEANLVNIRKFLLACVRCCSVSSPRPPFPSAKPPSMDEDSVVLIYHPTSGPRGYRCLGYLPPDPARLPGWLVALGTRL